MSRRSCSSSAPGFDERPAGLAHVLWAQLVRIKLDLRSRLPRLTGDEAVAMATSDAALFMALRMLPVSTMTHRKLLQFVEQVQHQLEDTHHVALLYQLLEPLHEYLILLEEHGPGLRT